MYIFISIVCCILVVTLVQAASPIILSWLENRRVFQCIPVFILSQVVVVLQLPQNVQIGVLRHRVAQLQLTMELLLRVEV